MRAILITMALVLGAAPPAHAQAGDDPAVLACEERERPQAADAAYKRLSASVEKDRVALAFETKGEGGAVQRNREECRFAVGDDGKWRLDGARSPARDRCETLAGEVKALIDQNRVKEAGAQRARMEVCLDVMGREIQRETVRQKLLATPNDKFAYPIPPSATALRAP